MSLQLPESAAAWPGQAFADTFCREVAHLPPGALPLHQALTIGSHVLDQPPQVMLLSSDSTQNHLTVKAGLFFRTVVAGCSCADDPTPTDENNEYCELLFRIDRRTGLTEVGLS